LVAAWALFAGGCNGSKESSSTAEHASKRAIDAAIVPNADFVVRIDINTIRQAPIIKQLEKVQGNTVDTKPAYEKFRQATGLTKDDVQAVVVSANTANFDFANGSAQTSLPQMTGVAAIELAKPLTTDKLIEGLKIILDNSKATISKFDIEGSQAVLMQSTKPDEPSAYAATSRDAKTVYIAFNKASLQAALQREKKRVMVASLPELQALSNSASQANLAFVAPQGLRDKFQAQLSKSQESPGGAMLSGFIAPFKDLRSVSLGINWDTGMQLDIAGDLGAAQAATQVAALIQTMGVPMLKSYAAKSSGKMSLNLDDQFKVSAEDTVLRISLRFTGGDIQAYRKAKDKTKTAALSHQQ
jgi:hypothetical protein